MKKSKKNILVISLFSNVFNVQWSCLSEVHDRYNFEFLLLFKDRKIENFLNEKNIKFYIVDYKKFDLYVKYFPFIRIVLKEIYYFLSYKSLRKKIGIKQNFLFINDNSLTIGKYFLKEFQENGKASFMYDYGLSLFNVKFVENITKRADKGFLKNFINKIEQKIKYYLIDKPYFKLKSPGYHPHDFGISHLLVINDISRQNALKIYNSFNDIVNVGNVQTLKYENQKVENHNYVLIILSNGYEVAEHYGLDKNSYFYNLRKVLSYLKKEKIDVVLKHHPNDKMKKYNFLKKEFSNYEWIKHNEKSNLDLISKAKIIISPMSTLAMEALFIKKPLLFFNYFNEKKETFEFFNEIFLDLPLLDLTKTFNVNQLKTQSSNISSEGYDRYINTVSFKKNFINFLESLD